MISELRQQYALRQLLQVAQVARSTYYYNCKPKPDKYAKERQEIARIFAQNKGRYGYRRILEILRQLGYKVNHKTVQKLMRGLGIQGKNNKKPSLQGDAVGAVPRYTDNDLTPIEPYRSYHGNIGRVAPNIINRDFEATEPYKKLVTDITEFTVCQAKIYLSPVMDLYNREILSYSISYMANFEQTRDMLNKLFEILPSTATPILHSDQGWQYQMSEFQQMLKEHNITQSMSRRGNCLDNSSMENFFGRLKEEMYYGEIFMTADEFVRCLEEYILYYNNDRISLKLNGLSPVQFKAMYKMSIL